MKISLKLPGRQFLIVSALSLTFTTLFVLSGYAAGLSGAVAALIYSALMWGPFVFLLVVPWLRGKYRKPKPGDDVSEFNYAVSVAAWKLPIGIVLVPVMFLLASAVQWVLEGQVQFQSLMPELLPKIYRQQDALAILAGSSAYLGQIAWNMGSVSPGEETLKVGLSHLWFLAFNKLNRPLILTVLTGLNFFWVGLHSLFTYTNLTQFTIAFLLGEILIMVTYILGTLVVAVIAHGIWNVLAAFALLSFVTVSIIGLLGVLLMLLLFKYRKRK